VPRARAAVTRRYRPTTAGHPNGQISRSRSRRTPHQRHQDPHRGSRLLCFWPADKFCRLGGRPLPRLPTESGLRATSRISRSGHTPISKVVTYSPSLWRQSPRGAAERFGVESCSRCAHGTRHLCTLASAQILAPHGKGQHHPPELPGPGLGHVARGVLGQVRKVPTAQVGCELAGHSPAFLVLTHPV
jgi:hypothetical protein